MNRSDIAARLERSAFYPIDLLVSAVEAIVREAVESERNGCANTCLMMAGNAVSIDDEAHLQFVADVIRSRGEKTCIENAEKSTDAKALRKENLKLCEGDWAVDDSLLAGKILTVLGISQDCSLEEGADYRRDYVAAALAADRKLRGDA